MRREIIQIRNSLLNSYITYNEAMYLIAITIGQTRFLKTLKHKGNATPKNVERDYKADKPTTTNKKRRTHK